MLAQILYITIRLAFARWRWRAYQKNIEDGNLMLAHELAQKFIREANKTEATEPRDNPYAPNNTTNNAQPDQQKKTSRSRTP